MEDVVLAEKRREQAIRDEGWQVVRWLWADLYRPGLIGDRLRRAFELAAADRPSDATDNRHHTHRRHVTPRVRGVT